MRILRLILSVQLLAMPITSYADEVTGKMIFDRWCIHCHGEGLGYPGTQRLGWDKGEELAVLEQRNDLSSAYVKIIVRNGLREMPGFRITEISNAELEKLATYLGKGK